MMMAIASTFLKNLLHVLRYPVLPVQSDLLGEFRVGAIQARIPSGPACQIHYPTLDDNTNTDNDASAKHKKKITTPYLRPEAVKGMADYSRQPVELLQFLSMRQHPCIINAKPIVDEQFPIVVFSHGLGGCMEMYTELCQQIASMGYWVIALEHEDGSGAYAESIIADNDGDDDNNKKTSAIYYKRPDDTPYSRQKVVNFRNDFLTQRVEEIIHVLDYVRFSSATNDKDYSNEETALLQIVCQAADKNPMNIHLLGHSFGGATMLRAVQHDKLTQRHPVASLSLLDCWAFSLGNDVLERGCSRGGGDNDYVPTLSILSEAWLSNPETEQVKQLLQNSSPLHTASFYCPNSMHVSFSDSVNWFPGFVTRSVTMRAPKEKRHATIRTTAQACVKHMMRQQQQQQLVKSMDESSWDKEDFLAAGLKEFPIDKSPVRQPTAESTVSAS